MHICAEKRGHMARNRRELQEGLKAQESRALTKFHKKGGTWIACPEVRAPLSKGPENFGGSQKDGFQKGGFGGCSPGTKTGTRVRSPKPPFWKPPFYLPTTLFGVDKRVVSKRVVSADVPPERKPERGYVRQNHPFTKPPFYLLVKIGAVRNLGQPAVCPRAIWPLTRAKSLCLCAVFLPGAFDDF